jgi:hypothetical protein
MSAKPMKNIKTAVIDVAVVQTKYPILPFPPSSSFKKPINGMLIKIGIDSPSFINPAWKIKFENKFT